MVNIKHTMITQLKHTFWKAIILARRMRSWIRHTLRCKLVGTNTFGNPRISLNKYVGIIENKIRQRVWELRFHFFHIIRSNSILSQQFNSWHYSDQNSTCSHQRSWLLSRGGQNWTNGNKGIRKTVSARYVMILVPILWAFFRTNCYQIHQCLMRPLLQCEDYFPASYSTNLKLVFLRLSFRWKCNCLKTQL